MKEYSDLELNKMITKLESWEESRLGEPSWSNWVFLGPLMVKYKVDIIHEFNERGFTRTEMANTETEFKSRLEIPRAIIMCILKSKNIIKG